MKAPLNVLFLGPADSSTLVALRDTDDAVEWTASAITAEEVAAGAIDFIVSHGYSHIVPGDALALVPGRAINLHVSMLPWNRGVHPNVWAVLENTPSGVTIHHMDDGLDTGDIIAQVEVPIQPDATFRSSYTELQAAVLQLFTERWPAIREGKASSHKQPEGGSYHRDADLERVKHLLVNGWDTPVAGLIGAVRRP